MSDDNNESGTPEAPDTTNPTETIEQVAGQIGTGLDRAAGQIPEDETEVRAVVETAGDIATAVGQVTAAAGAAQDLGEALEAGDEARAASAVGNLAGGVLGTAGAAIDGIADTMPEEVRGAVQTAATVTRAVGGAARATQQVVETVQQIERAIVGRRVVFQSGAELGEHGRLRAESATGHQTLSGLYEFKVRVVHDHDGGLDDDAIDALLNNSARLGLNQDTAGEGDIYGMVRRVEMLPMTAPRPTHYELTIVPKLWRLTRVTRSRVYQDMSHLEVVLEVLRLHGFEPGTHVFDDTEEEYAAQEYVVQYRETDYAFVSRLLAHNGIHIAFAQEAGTEAIHLGDRNAAFQPLHEHDELRYHPHDFAPEDGLPRVWGLRRVREPGVRRVVLREYNWRVPHHPLRAQEPVDENTGYGFLDLWGDHFRDDEQGARFARIRAEEQRVRGEVFKGKTSLRGVRPGSYFDLVNHPNETFNQRYLVIATEEEMNDGHAYVNTFEAIPYDVVYRPPRTVPWPRVDGVINAIVDGEQRSTATPLDEQGRYRLVVPLDEVGRSGGRASRWVRRAQPSAGAGYGMHLPLHIGTEVAVAHVNGDPDRPIILGAVPNAATPSPVVGGNAPHSRIRTGSGAVIELDDDC
ncbi:MAG: type VI secretion system tip protein VgrG [Myxococcales bacterium]|nr:type VI secretion system tip protein VgrG [Myxococcales bacterium]